MTLLGNDLPVVFFQKKFCAFYGFHSGRRRDISVLRRRRRYAARCKRSRPIYRLTRMGADYASA